MKGCSLDGTVSGGAVLGNSDGVGFHIEGDVTSNSLTAHVVKTEQAEGVFVVDVEGTFPGEPKEKVPISASASTSSPSFPLSRYAFAT